ncbi:YidC/Oxa1 family membrane protein insertase [Candidatus Peribacteria bacterium]|nr:YidC/Oxa1 family membrane protein insertase [Candidatus Peribacteria bacterium]
MADAPQPSFLSQLFNRRFFLTFVVVYGVIFLAQQFWLKPAAEREAAADPVVSLTPAKDTYREGQLVLWEVRNRTEGEITLVMACDGSRNDRYTIEKVSLGSTEPLMSTALCEGEVPPLPVTLTPGMRHRFSIPEYNTAMFGTAGQYTLQLPYTVGASPTVETLQSTPVTIKTPGAIRNVFRSIITRPLFNVLAWVSNTLPGKSFGWGIVLVTLAVRLLLFIPNQKAMRSQEVMKEIQPKLKQLQEQYKDNQQLLALKTMELYKQYNVSPVSSCLPILLQFPVLIGFYYMVQEGLGPHLHDRLYSFLQYIDLSALNNHFFTLDLTRPNPYVLPIIVGVAQWVNIRISMGRAKKKKATAPEATTGMPDMSNMMGMMQWIFPVMIGFFTAGVPAAVGIYWLTSTVFGSLQQWYVHRQMAQEKPVKQPKKNAEIVAKRR